MVQPVLYCRSYAAILVGTVAFCLVFIARTAFIIDGVVYFSLFDDAMVSMRYARNLAAGDGLVWNAGETPVEGYTNLLWTLWMAVLHLFEVSDSKVSLLVMLSGVLILMANVHVAAQIAGALSGGSRVASLVAAALTAGYYPLLYWTMRGMEVGALILVVNISVLETLRLQDRRDAWGVWRVMLPLILGVLIRPDGVIPYVVVGVFAVVALRDTARISGGAILVLGLVLTLGSLTAFRLAYYGDPLPNTYYLKVDGVSAAERLVRGVSALAMLVVTHLLPAIVVVAMGRREASLSWALLMSVFGAQCAYSAYVGGDAWEWMGYANRYICIGVPSLLVLCSVVLSTHRPTGGRGAVAFVRVVLCASAVTAIAIGLAMLSVSDEPSTFFGRYGLPRLALGGLATVAGLAILGLAVKWGPAASGRSRRVERVVAYVQRRGPAAFAGSVAAVLLLGLSGPAFARWIFGNAAIVSVDMDTARLGIELARLAPVDATIAVSSAGAIPYFARRRAIDLLGKNDRIVARGEPRAPFFPGHNKWDHEFSIGKLQPDIVIDPWLASQTDREYIAALGYERLCGGLYILRRRDSAQLLARSRDLCAKGA